MSRVEFHGNADLLSVLTDPQSRQTLKDMIDRQSEFDDAVDRFASEMKKKLAVKTLEGYYGGLEPENSDDVLDKLYRHWEKFHQGDKNQIVDIANLLMMHWAVVRPQF